MHSSPPAPIGVLQELMLANNLKQKICWMFCHTQHRL